MFNLAVSCYLSGSNSQSQSGNIRSIFPAIFRLLRISRYWICKFLITGDFNIHVKGGGGGGANDCKRSNEILLAAFNLSQFVTQPTYTSGNTLDLLITSQPKIRYFKETQVGFYISDYAFVTCLMGAEKPGRERKDIRLEILNL